MNGYQQLINPKNQVANNLLVFFPLTTPFP